MLTSCGLTSPPTVREPHPQLVKRLTALAPPPLLCVHLPV
uniref:Uncharacterized protein n=1 Tax=Anguilla anguilla TaxID=7936 RepID=A0A0E9TEK2_ANGAN